jgi:protein-S-isoprenylcysteine O-methyltransferase Ste14
MTTATVAPRSTPDSRPRPLAGRLAILLYGVAVYALFLATFLYLIGFVAGAVVPGHIDSGEPATLARALLVNGAFLTLFAVQHAIMARPWFKRRWTRIVPAAAERSTFVLVTCAILIAMVVCWQPLPATVWHVEGPLAIVLWSVCALGWATVLVSTFLIDHFELFGLSQVVRNSLGRPPAAPRFQERVFYRYVRHPLMTGFLLAFWSTPHMTQGHLFFAIACTGYILVGTRSEERDLIAAHGESYLSYKRRVPGLIPCLRGPKRRAAGAA